MEVKVLLDSINPYNGVRLTTLHCTYPQFIHQQVLTHRAFSRNSSSLRAISFKRASDWETVFPTWTLEQKGMQGSLVNDVRTQIQADAVVMRMQQLIFEGCERLEKLGIHHQDINNYIRPFQNIETVITATDWKNFFDQRLHESTKPDMQKLAQLINAALDESKPVEKFFHIPMIDDINLFSTKFSSDDLWRISAARLARISYFKWTDDPNKDLELAKKLIADKHPSPFEHVAFAKDDDKYYANFKSWRQLRHVIGF